MAIMRRGKGLSLRRRVPNRYASIEPRREIWLSLHTDSETIARQKEGRVWQEQIEAWEARLAGDTAEAEARHPAAWAAFERRDADYDFATGESLRTMFARVTGRLRALAAAHPGETIAVVVHGGVLDIVNRFVRGNPLETPRDFLIPNAGLNWVVLADGVWAIESWGETAHLEPGALDELPS